MHPELEIQLIAIIVSLACSLLGVFLVLRGMTMMADAITHTILLGIVVAFFATENLASPFLIVGAALMGVFTVWLTELLHQTRLLAKDASIGVVFPLLFSIAIILISRYAGSVHLDTDSVLLGELAFAPFERMVIFGVDIGAQGIYSMGIILIINLIFILLFYKELKLATFDAVLAAALGFSPVILHYALMTLVSVTAVGAFEAVGSILVVAFIVGPPVTAYLLTNELKKMLWISGIVGVIDSIVGFQLAMFLDVSIAGMIAVIIGLTFLLVFIFSPKKGLIQAVRQRNRQKKELAYRLKMEHIK
ncbi:zinc ABC transporter permease [Carnobacterium divergens]|uniref:metal ABC transporter permease n=1 Tax=Carnobacterium divergens TaxID=2748 RepID=UPI00107202CB|nr:metal ABC transporter permease [Carnobacterium divergens]MDT1995557.1 metal ABC transporter permease [Carnobacterium divergens]TFI62971.1 zinc ABC transporter permease [Carnobacterium divergens]TFI63323.1 zinc ABC transporter permease [Carnobacterium divergens]TFI66770.1 zinc ABC transporter permease [Carnobacterium divergens]TFI78316.1 zinc ABC transporter permease [Carnobacterium divergens]